jgi:bisphosphoglycerate-independent phosphoglycerate mutase (AlkP superfamily)
MTNRQKPLSLRILDGSDIRIKNDYNPLKLAKTPCSDSYLQNHPHAELDYFSIGISLPHVQMGALEVVHPHKKLSAV